MLRRELQGSEDSLEGLRKEVVDAHRALREEALEKDMLQRSNAELRATVRKAEEEKARYGSTWTGCGESPSPQSSLPTPHPPAVIGKGFLTKLGQMMVGDIPGRSRVPTAHPE